MAMKWKAFKRGRKTVWRRVSVGRDYYVCRTSPPYGYGKRKGIAVSKTIDGLPAYCLHPIRRVLANSAREAKRKASFSGHKTPRRAGYTPETAQRLYEALRSGRIRNMPWIRVYPRRRKYARHTTRRR